MRSEDFNKESRILKALANSTRLAIVKELLKKEKCVNDIKELLDARQANISQHLAVLRWADIVGCRFVGTMRCYYLKCPEIISRLLELLKKIKT
jgi:DNA-binding transcriptional ArsR family regulator